MNRSGKALQPLRWVVMSTLLSSAVVLAGQDQHAVPPQETAPDQLNEIVVSRRKGAPAAKLDAISYLQRYCFDANRLKRQSAPPEDDLSWEPLDDKTRARLEISDPDVPAFGLVDQTRRHTLVIKFETIHSKNYLRENRCTLVMIGGEDHEELPARITTIMRGRGTQRHVGHPAGAERIGDWQQWLWTAMPSRRSKSWQSSNASSGGRTSDSWIVVTNEALFFSEYDYVFVDLKTRGGADAKVSMVTFGHKTREKREPPG